MSQPDEAFIKEVNYNLMCRQIARLQNDKVVIDIMRGSLARHNQHKVAELSYPKQKAIEMMAVDTFIDLVNFDERALNIPLTTYR